MEASFLFGAVLKHGKLLLSRCSYEACISIILKIPGEVYDSDDMKVLIVGGGIGGLALGAFLRMHCIDFDIIEKQPYKASQGYLIGLWSNSRQVFRALNLGQAFETLGRDVGDYRLLDSSGATLRIHDFQEFRDRYQKGLSIFERDVVYQLLLTKVGIERIRFEESLVSLTQSEHSVRVTTSKGITATYDLVVGADGVLSQVRDLIFPNAKANVSTWCSSWTWINTPLFHQNDVTHILADSCMMVFLTSPHKTALNYFYHEKYGVEAKRFVARFFEKHGIREYSHYRAEQFNLRTVDLKSWSSGQVVLLGDAAHCTHPYAALGASMALEDGMKLASLLHKVDETFTIRDALKQYEKERKQRLRIMRKVTGLIERLTQIESRFMRRYVNKLIPLVPESLLLHNFKKLFDETLSS